jgi:transposase
MTIFSVDRMTISHWFDAWEAHHFAGWYDKKGCGRPHKLTEDEQAKAQQYLEQPPRDVKKVVHLVEQETTKRVSTKTLQRLIKKSALSGNASKKSPEKRPDPHPYERSKALIQQLHQREAIGACAVGYVDATGLCLTPYMPDAWQPMGAPIAMPAATHRHRLNVLGFLYRRHALHPYLIEGKVDTLAIVECFEQFSQQLTKRTYVFLDNAPVHKSQEFMRHIAQWVQRGLMVKYLPPYSPELNLIEILWRFMKYYWLPFSAYMSFPCLSRAIEDILTRFGTDYIISFETIGI